MSAANDTNDVPIHPLFVDEAEHAPLTQKIETIDVLKRNSAGKYVFLEWYDADVLTDERAVREAFGPGSYKFDGKDKERSRILRKSFRDIGGVEPAAAAAAPAPAASSGTSDLIEYMKIERVRADADRERERQDRREERERELESRKEILGIVTTFATASLNANAARGAAAAPAANPMAQLKEAAETLAEIRLTAHAERDLVREELKAEQEAAGEKDGGVLDTFIASFGTGMAKKVGIDMTPPPKAETH